MFCAGCPCARLPSRFRLDEVDSVWVHVDRDALLGLGNFTSLDLNICLHCFCADSSSPQISAICFGHFTVGKESLHKSLRFSAKLPRKSHENDS